MKRQQEVSFTVNKRDAASIRRIARRAHSLSVDYRIDYPLLDCSMDLTACHANGCPLDLPRLESADDANFGHDVFGIRRHLDRTTGSLTQCFIPRCAAKQARASW